MLGGVLGKTIFEFPVTEYFYGNPKAIPAYCKNPHAPQKD